eukprot:tig00020704_g13200.t1
MASALFSSSDSDEDVVDGLLAPPPEQLDEAARRRKELERQRRRQVRKFADACCWAFIALMWLTGLGGIIYYAGVKKDELYVVFIFLLIPACFCGCTLFIIRRAGLHDQPKKKKRAR